MLTCKICHQKYKTLRFNSPRICVCGRCTNSLNEYSEVAEASYRVLGERLQRGILKRAFTDLSSPNTPSWKIDKSQRIINNIEQEPDYINALPGWINRQVKDKENRKKEFKIIRAHRRGLIHRNRPQGWGYPTNWSEVASRIRALDDYTCINCGAQDLELHVHHIVYVSNFGTHQKKNLVTLCRECHEKEHKKVFDFGENLTETDGFPIENL